MWFELCQTQGHFCLCFPKCLTLGRVPRGSGSAYYTRFGVPDCQVVPQFLTHSHSTPTCRLCLQLDFPASLLLLQIRCNSCKEAGPQPSQSCACPHGRTYLHSSSLRLTSPPLLSGSSCHITRPPCYFTVSHLGYA